MAGIREQRKSLRGSPRKLIIWKARRCTSRFVTERLKNEDWLAMSESVYAELRLVGFGITYESGLQFLEWYCDRLQARPAALL